MRFRTYVILGVALLMGNLQLQARSVDLEYDTEWQTDFRGKYNWVNLLRLDGSLDLSNDFTIEAATISIAKTAAEPIIDDLQGFSNIEEENLALGIAKLGAEYRNRRSTFFLGIRNVNEDYFTTPVTSLFLNSSCGIFPTISSNYDIANYPLSSWCFHYKAEWDNLTLQTSLYDGQGHRRIAGHDNIFSFSPKRNGLFSITSAEYDKNGSNYSLGCALFYGVHHCDDISIEETASPESSQALPNPSKSVSIAPWFNVEQRIYDKCSIMFQGSFSTAKTDCRYYFGLGGSYDIDKATLGIFADYARFSDISESVAELTCDMPLTTALSIQPSIQIIRTGSHITPVSLLRLKISL